MKDISKIRNVVARFFQVPESEVTESFIFPPHRLQSSLGRSTFHSAIKRLAQVDLPRALTARNFGELIGGQPAALSAAPAPPTAAEPDSPAPAPLAAQPFRLQTGVDIAALDELPAAGTPELDAGSMEADAGFDAGSMPPDAGTVEPDAGVPHQPALAFQGGGCSAAPLLAPLLALLVLRRPRNRVTRPSL